MNFKNIQGSLVGPPENTREHVVAASRAMLAGDWKKCRDYIVNEKMNQVGIVEIQHIYAALKFKLFFREIIPLKTLNEGYLHSNDTGKIKLAIVSRKFGTCSATLSE